MKQIVVVGGVAAGMSAASKARRLEPTANIIAFDRTPFVSYGSCGMPYNLLRPDEPMEKLVVISAQKFKEKRNIEARVRTDVIGIDPKAGRVTTRNLDSGEEEVIPYDSLIYSTGAEAIEPPFEGRDLDGIFVFRDLTHGIKVKDFLATHNPKKAVVIGGGYIGLEMADVLTELGLAVTVIKRTSILAGYVPEVVQTVREGLATGGVTLLEGTIVTGFGGNGRVERVFTKGPDIEADIVIIAAGVRPATNLAKETGIALGVKGAVAVDRELRTNIDGIWSAGDCAEQYHRLLDRNDWVPLGTNANKQGRIAGENAVGGHVQYPGIIGTVAFRTLGNDVARTGVSPEEAASVGWDVDIASIDATDVAHAFGPHKPIKVVLISRHSDGRLVGAQLVGSQVAKRADVLAAAITAKMTIADLRELDLTYAPPFAPVWDSILVAANVAKMP